MTTRGSSLLRLSPGRCLSASARNNHSAPDHGNDGGADTPDKKREKAGKLPADANVAVLGGGLTGLTAAYYLAKWLPPTAKITLLEASDRLGGWIRTERVPVKVGGVEGVVSFERGPRSLSSLNKSTWRFDDLVLWDLVRLHGVTDVVSPPDRPRYIYYPDHLVPLPPHTSLAAFASEPLVLESLWAGFGYVLRRLFSRKDGVPVQDLSIADWIQHITGSRAVAENLASAMVHGIYGGDIYTLSARSVLDRFYWVHYLPALGPNVRHMALSEQVFMEAMGQDPLIRKLAQQPRGALLHFGEAGMEALPIALGDALNGQANVEVKLGAKVTGLEYESETEMIKITTADQGSSPEKYHKVISTLPSQHLARITDALPSLAPSHAVSIMTVNIWYPQPNLKPPGFGYLIPLSVPAEQNPERALGVFFDSDVGVRGPDEPPGTKLFVLMGGHYYDDKKQQPGAASVHVPSEEEAVQQAKRVLERHLGIPQSTPCFAMARLASGCIPQYVCGHQDAMAAADEDLRDSFDGRLAVAGGSYTKIGAMGALRNGYDIASTVAREDWLTTGLEQLEFPTQFCGVPTERIPVRRFSRR
ncbi:Protoporphyrinogen oxidase [Trichoderma citrinoviride]|uniref:Protoporphyrinogen oxidase n=1 Tax=Trichoderma citrinoviride TaxID=58853 RepID=A0A2T4B4A2_9HYPO|nr:Protoporphyrinogen oxidase [Trichoderma citrinoviride]PTB64159.1 Protoporphyrinogen oxidase [Trichoderma citrinoviride]